MVSLTVYRTKLLLWDQSPSDKEVVVSYDGDSLHTFLLDLDNVAGASTPALGKVVYLLTVYCIQCCGAGPLLTGSGSRYFFSPAPAPLHIKIG